MTAIAAARPNTISVLDSAPLCPNSASIRSPPEVVMLPIASAPEKTTPITVSVATCDVSSSAQTSSAPKKQHRDGADHRMDVERERHADARQRDMREGISGKRHPPHDRETTDETGGDRHRGGKKKSLTAHERETRPACRRTSSFSRSSPGSSTPAVGSSSKRTFGLP